MATETPTPESPLATLIMRHVATGATTDFIVDLDDRRIFDTDGRVVGRAATDVRAFLATFEQSKEFCFERALQRVPVRSRMFGLQRVTNLRQLRALAEPTLTPADSAPVSPRVQRARDLLRRVETEGRRMMNVEAARSAWTIVYLDRFGMSLALPGTLDHFVMGPALDRVPNAVRIRAHERQSDAKEMGR